MKASLLIFALALTVLSVSVSAGPPQVPPFKVEKNTSDYEVRSYADSTWVTTNTSGGLAVAVTTASVPLLRYVKGKNDEDRSVGVGKPVLVGLFPTAKFAELSDNKTVAFYLTEDAKDTAPKPDDEDLYIIEKPDDTEVIVRSFGGFADEEKALKEAGKLAQALDEDKIQYVGDAFFLAIYDPPTTLTDRHNEIWFAPKKSAVTTA
jgi:hypothetical protein